MPHIRYLPISCLDESILQPLMDEEAAMWMEDLNWDYTSTTQILRSYIRQKLLPGYAAIADNRAIGYAYFLVNQSKAVIGAIYALRNTHSQEALNELIALSVSSLKDSRKIQRIEAQIMPFHNLNLTDAFTENGFSHSPRFYLELDLNMRDRRTESDFPSDFRIIPWCSEYLAPVAEMMKRSYEKQIDAEISQDYRTRFGCENYLRSLIANSGCGIFMPASSRVALDCQGLPSGFVFCSRISPGSAIIPQIAITPDYQGIGLGSTLMNHALVQLKALCFSSLCLTVTQNNLRAREWYRRMGFRIRKEFGAYVWQR